MTQLWFRRVARMTQLHTRGGVTIPMSPEPLPSTYDFEAHRREAVEKYRQQYALYEEFAEVVKRALEEALASREIKVASIEARAKSIESFGRKASESSPADPNQPK